MRCPATVSVLSNPYDPFPKPSASTKSDFESKTAAINVTVESRSTFSLEEVKKDATWLSGKAKIDEVSALRIVLLEWQNRSRDQLLNKYSREEINSLRDAVGFDIDNITDPVDRSEPSGILAYTAAQNAGSVNADSEEARKSRLFLFFLSEKLHILKLSRYFQSISVGDKWPSCNDPGVQMTTDVGTPEDNELAEMAHAIFGNSANTSTGARSVLSVQAGVDAVRGRINSLEGGSCWSTENDGDVNIEIELIWQEAVLDELYQIVQILFLRLKIADAVTSSEQLLSWLRLMAEYSFLGHFQPVRLI